MICKTRKFTSRGRTFVVVSKFTRGTETWIYEVEEIGTGAKKQICAKTFHKLIDEGEIVLI